MRKIILLTLTVYLFIAPITYHPDTKLVLYYATLGNEKVWNIYKYLDEHHDNAPKFHYPPANYWIVKAELPLVKLIAGKEIVGWLGTGSNIAFLDENIFLYNLASKTPILLLILLTGFLVYKIVLKAGYKKNQAKLATLIWYLNPITIFSGVIMGQNDILAIFPFILGLYFYYDKPLVAFMIFGLASSIKSFPLIWTLALAGVYPTKSWLKKIGLFALGFFVYAITILPFIKYDYFVNDVMRSGLAMRMFENVINIGSITMVPLVPALLTVTTLFAIKNKMGINLVGLSILLVTINLMLLGFSNFNPQWLIWFMPFISILLVLRGGYRNFLLILILFVGITLLFDDKYLYWGLLTPINNNLINMPFISEILVKHKVNVHWLDSCLKLFLSLTSVYWLYLCAKFKK
ncbi:MAG: hypothetical protein WCV93_02205 [Candidatus Shapirobacteria bacterium]|jgi:hypothetical protein